MIKEITAEVKNIGVDDHITDLFEGQYKVPRGMSYNSYLIVDEKTAVTDTVSEKFGDEWLENLREAIGDRSPDYLIIHHMEPDHSANIIKFTERYPETTVVANSKAFAMIDAFFGEEKCKNRMTVANGDTLNLGRHSLKFIFAPMVHWPEVMLSFDTADGILFSADAFGKFGASDSGEEWLSEARRYYFGIVGKYGAQVQNLLKAARTLDIKTICPLHGPVLCENIGYYVEKYSTWSAYSAETDGVLIAYTSVYGHTKAAAELLFEKLKDAGCKEVVIRDLARCDMSEAVSDAFRFPTTVLATTTYNAGIFPPMHEFINMLTERNFRNRKIALIENGSWAPAASKTMRSMLEGAKDLTFTDTTVTVRSALNEKSLAELDNLAAEICS